MQNMPYKAFVEEFCHFMDTRSAVKEDKPAGKAVMTPDSEWRERNKPVDHSCAICLRAGRSYRDIHSLAGVPQRKRPGDFFQRKKKIGHFSYNFAVLHIPYPYPC